jgi:uroporphyrinogen-III synthase
MNRSLKGLRVLNTRPKHQAPTFSELIRQAEGIAFEFPTIEIKQSHSNWIDKIPALHQINHAIFISANAVIYCFDLLKERNIVWPSHINVIAIGNGTAKLLEHYQIRVNEIPLIPDSEHLLTLNSLQQLTNQTVLLFKGEGGRQIIENHLLRAGANTIILPVYQRTLPIISNEIANSLWRENAVDIILLTSEQSLQNLFKLFSTEAHTWLQNKPFLVISDRLAQAASIRGVKKIITSHPDKMMDALFDYKGLIHGR